MAWAHVISANGQNTSPSGTVDAVFGTAVTAGGFMVAEISYYSGAGGAAEIASVTDSGGNEWFKVISGTNFGDGAGSNSVDVWWAIATTGGTITVTATSNTNPDYMAIGVDGYSFTSGTVQAVAQNSAGAYEATSIPTGSATFSGNALVIGAVGFSYDTLTTFSWNSGFTARQSIPYVLGVAFGLETCDVLNTTTSPVNPTGTSSVSSDFSYGGATVVFQCSGDVGPTSITLSISGSASSNVGTASGTITATLDKPSFGTTSIALSVATITGTFATTPVVITNGNTTGTFTFTPTSAGTGLITASSSGLSNGTLSYTGTSVAATSYTAVASPTTVAPSGTVTVPIVLNGLYTGTITGTPSGSGAVGLSSVVKTYANSSTTQNATWEPESLGTLTITWTNSGSLSNPANNTITVTNVLTYYTAASGVSGTPTFSVYNSGTNTVASGVAASSPVQIGSTTVWAASFTAPIGDYDVIWDSSGVYSGSVASVQITGTGTFTYFTRVAGATSTPTFNVYDAGINTVATFTPTSPVQIGSTQVWEASFTAAPGNYLVVWDNSGTYLGSSPLLTYADQPSGSGTFPTSSQVLNGVSFGPTDNLTGNVVLPAIDTVETGITYGPNSELTGIYGGGGGDGSVSIPIIGENVIMPLTWTGFTNDTVFSGLATPGLVAAGSGQNGMLVSNSGQNVTEITFTITGQGGTNFNPHMVLIGYLADINGTLYETPVPPGHPGFSNLEPLLPYDISVTTFSDALLVPTQNASGFRFYVKNNGNVGVIVSPLNYNQA